MHDLRRLLQSHRAIAGLVIALALTMKVLVPAGFMPSMTDGRIVVSVCSGAGSSAMVVAIPGTKHGDGERDGGKHEAPCAFTGLSVPVIMGADPSILALAIVFVMAMGLRAAAVLRVAMPRSLRPPLRAPPTIA